MKRDPSLKVALDIGTSKIAALAASKQGNQLEVAALAQVPSLGLKRGMVVDMERTIDSIGEVIQALTEQLSYRPEQVVLGISGSHIRSQHSHGMVALSQREVTSRDIEQILESAQAVALPADERILHVIPHHYALDHQRDIYQPLGMLGVRLEADVHLITANISAVENMVRAVERSGLMVDDVVLQPLASGLSALSEDERVAGVVLLDIGAGTTDLAVFSRGNLIYTSVIPIGGDHVTQDLAMALRLPVHVAESLKRSEGVVSAFDSETRVTLNSGFASGVQEIPVSFMSEIITARYQDILQLAQEKLLAQQLPQVSAGVVLSGKGACIPGLMELTSNLWELPVRVGYPTQGILASEISEDPGLATGVGLLHYAFSKMPSRPKHTAGLLPSKALWQRMRDWFEMHF